MPSDAPQDGAPAPKVDFTSALAKVKAIAAKLGSSASSAAAPIPATAPAPSASVPPMMKRPYEEDSYGHGHGGHDNRDDGHYGKRMAYDSGRDSGPIHRPGLGSQVSHYAPPMRTEHTIQEEMGVPGNLVGLIIGRGGENLKRIERETGCKVQFSQDGGPNDRERFVNIVGQPAGIAEAKRQIQEIITSSQTGERPGGYGGYGGGGNYGMGADRYGSGSISSTMQIPSTKVGLVIGRRGETIRDLQDRSGARIAVTPTPQDQNSPSRTITITGDESAIERAKTFIDEIVNDMAPRGPYSSGGGFQNTPPVTMTVPQESIGLVIGRGGETVKQLQIQSRAKIQVQQVDPNLPTPSERTINLFGPPEAVEYAKQLIMEKVNGARDNDRYGNREQGGYGGSSGGYGGYGGYNQQQSYQQPAQSSSGGYGQQYGTGYGATTPAAAPAAATGYTPEQQAAYAQYYGYNYGTAATGYGATTSTASGTDATAASTTATTPAIGSDTTSYGTYDYSRYAQYGTTSAAATTSSAVTSSSIAAVTPTATGTTPVTSTAADTTATTTAATATGTATATSGAAVPDYSAYYAQQEAYQQYYSQYYGYQAAVAAASGTATGADTTATTTTANGSSTASTSATDAPEKNDSSSSDAAANS
ncbi:hypothetical protein FBU30_005140 [Linnemannia zychae]|nr:hypothetical protein FBU30_005140 [Linnemannia zychae]